MPQPAAIRAKKTLDWAVRVGKARRWSCFDCGVPFPKSKPRFEDPNRPLTPRWYCDICWRKDARAYKEERQGIQAEAIASLDAQSCVMRFKTVLADLDRSPTLREEMVGRVRATLPEKLKDLHEDAPLFRQLLVKCSIGTINRSAQG